MNSKLDTGRVFERIFSFYGSQFTLLIPAALVLFIPVAVLNGLLESGDANALTAILTLVIGIVASFWYQGMVVEATRDIIDGRRDHTIGSLFSSAAPFILPLFGVGILAGFAIGIGLILLIVPGLILLTIWAVIVPAIVIDRVGVFESFGRSRGLVRDNGWRVFGVLLVLFLLSIVLGGIASAIGAASDSFVGYAAADLVVNVLIVPLTGVAATVLYVDLRRIKGEPLPEAGAPAELPGEQPPPEPPAGPEAPAAPPPGPQAPPAGPETPPR